MRVVTNEVRRVLSNGKFLRLFVRSFVCSFVPSFERTRVHGTTQERANERTNKQALEPTNKRANARPTDFEFPAQDKQTNEETNEQTQERTNRQACQDEAPNVSRVLGWSRQLFTSGVGPRWKAKLLKSTGLEQAAPHTSGGA